MAFTLDQLSIRFRADMGGRYEFICADVTSDATAATINASTLGWTSINSAMIVSKAHLEGTMSLNIGTIDADEGLTLSVPITGADLGDHVMMAMDADLKDMQHSVGIAEAGIAEIRLENRITGANTDLGDPSFKAIVLKNIGLSTRSGTYIVTAPILRDAEVFTVWLIGH